MRWSEAKIEALFQEQPGLVPMALEGVIALVDAGDIDGAIFRKPRLLRDMRDIARSNQAYGRLTPRQHSYMASVLAKHYKATGVWLDRQMENVTEESETMEAADALPADEPRELERPRPANWGIF